MGFDKFISDFYAGDSRPASGTEDGDAVNDDGLGTRGVHSLEATC